MKKILMIDDEPQFIKAHKEALEDERDDGDDGDKKYTVIIERISDNAMSCIKEEKPDLVILDLLMPLRETDPPDADVAETGVGILRDIRLKHPKLPVIILSVVTRSSIIEQVRSTTATTFIQKPASVAELIDVVQRMI